MPQNFRHRRESDFKVFTNSEQEPNPPSHAEIPQRLHALENAFAAHRHNNRSDKEEQEEAFEKWRDEKLEPRIRALEDHRLSSTTYILAAGATIGVIFTSLMAILGLLSGVLKWSL